MHTVLTPSEVDSSSLTESAPDNTSPEKIIFFHAEQGKPLATPWQVALTRSRMVNKSALGKGIILESENGIIDGTLEAQFISIDKLFEAVGVNE